MNHRFATFIAIVFCVLALPYRSPAPLVYRPDEGWVYEKPGADTKWIRQRAKDQLEVAQAAFDKKDYGLALKAARHLTKTWPLSDYAPRAQYLMGRCYEARRQDQKAFDHYQTILQKYPKSENVKEVLAREYDIATRYLGGQWFKLWGFIPAFPSMDRTAEMFDKIVKNGPYSDVAPHSQLGIGAAREKQSHYPEAVKAYEMAADRYHDQPLIASDAIYRAGIACQKQAKTADYDQSTAGQAIAQFTDFITLYPKDERVKQAQTIIASLRIEQARGNFEIARYYEKRKKWNGALIYYNEVVLRDPNSALAVEARKRIDAIKQRTQTAQK